MDTIDAGVDAPHHVVASAGAEARAALWPTFRKVVANTKSSYNYLFLLFCYMHICIISFYKSVKIFVFMKSIVCLKKIVNIFFISTSRCGIKTLHSLSAESWKDCVCRTQRRALPITIYIRVIITPFVQNGTEWKETILLYWAFKT